MRFTLPVRTVRDQAVKRNLEGIEKHLNSANNEIRLTGGCVLRYDEANKRLTATAEGVTVTLHQF